MADFKLIPENEELQIIQNYCLEHALDSDLPETREDLGEVFNLMIKHNIINRDGFLQFYILNGKAVGGDPGVNLVFKEDYDFENEEFVPTNMDIYNDISTNASYLISRNIYNNIPTEIQKFYDWAVTTELPYRLENDRYWHKCIEDYIINNKLSGEEIPNFNTSLNNYRNTIHELLNTHFIFNK